MHVTPTTDTRFPSIRFVSSLIEIAGTKTTMETTMPGPTQSNSSGTGQFTKVAPPGLLLDSLILPTFKDLKAAHYRIAAESREARERASREFRVGQPHIYEYLPYGPSTLRALAYENALICSLARHVCAAMEIKHGKVPVLRVEDLQATEARAKTLLAHRPTLKQVEKLGAVQFAVGGIVAVHYFDGIRVIPDRKRVLLKVLTLLMCFSAANDRTPSTQ
jgi:hypothetical protein